MSIVKLFYQHSREATQIATIIIINYVPTSVSVYNNKFNYLSFQ